MAFHMKAGVIQLRSYWWTKSGEPVGFSLNVVKIVGGVFEIAAVSGISPLQKEDPFLGPEAGGKNITIPEWAPFLAPFLAQDFLDIPKFLFLSPFQAPASFWNLIPDTKNIFS